MPTQVQRIEKIVNLMAEHEETIGELYKQYEKRFPNFPLWKKLVCEEHRHAAWIRTFLNQTNFSSLSINSRAFPERKIQKSIDSLKNQIKRAHRDSLYGALKNSFRIETMILEQKNLKIFTTRNDRIAKRLDDLTKATEHHAESVYKELKKFDAV